MELRHFGSVIWRYRWVIVATTLAAAAIALGFAVRGEASYDASTTLRLTTPSALSSGQVRLDDLEYTERLENTYAELLESRPAREEVGARLGTGEAVDVRVEPRPATELFDVVGNAPTRAEAVAVADGAAALLLERVAELGDQGLRTSDALFEQRIAELEAELAQDRTRRRDLVGKTEPGLVVRPS